MAKSRVELINSNKGEYYSLDGLGEKIISILKDEKYIDSIVDRLLNYYDVDRDTCKRAVIDYLDVLINAGVIAIQNE